MKVNIFRTLKDIDKELWNSIIKKNNISKSYDFLLSVEQSLNIENEYWYVMFWKNQELVAHTCIFTHYTKLEEVTDVFISIGLLNKIRKYHKNFLKLKLLGCGTPVATCSNVLTIKEEGFIEEVLSDLNMILLDIGKKQKVASIMIRDFIGNHHKIGKQFLHYGYKEIESLPTSFVKIKWDNFEDYLNSFKSKTKVKMRRNIKRFHSDELEVKLIEDFSPYVEAMNKLYKNVYKKAVNKFEKLNEDFFTQINNNLDNTSKAILVFKGEEIVGIELIVEDEDYLRPLYVGLDYDFNEQYRLYFNMIYLIVKTGIERKKDYVELGQTCYLPKIKAGAYVEKMYMYIRFRNNLVNKLFGNSFYKMFKNFAYESAE